jgi:hypothetical protein
VLGELDVPESVFFRWRVIPAVLGVLLLGSLGLAWRHWWMETTFAYHRWADGQSFGESDRPTSKYVHKLTTRSGRQGEYRVEMPGNGDEYGSDMPEWVCRATLRFAVENNGAREERIKVTVYNRHGVLLAHRDPGRRCTSGSE